MDAMKIPELLFCKVFFKVAPPTEICPEEAMLVFIAGGLKSGTVTLETGESFFEFSKNKASSMLLLTPPGANVRLAFKGEATEVVFFHFRHDALVFGETFGRASVVLPGKRKLYLATRQPLNADEVMTLRPVVQTIWESTYGDDGDKVAATWAFPYLLTKLFVTGAKHYYGILDPVERLRAYIEADTANEKNIAEMARELKHSVTHLREAFKREYGITPQDYREELRFKRAMHYIQKTKVPFRIIGLRLGMRGRNYLSTYMRIRTGKTPREIRKDASF